MSPYAKAIAALVSLLVAFALDGERGEDLYNEVELVITAVTTAIVFTIPNRPKRQP